MSNGARRLPSRGKSWRILGAQLFKLRVERLPVGAHAGIAEAAGF